MKELNSYYISSEAYSQLAREQKIRPFANENILGIEINGFLVPHKIIRKDEDGYVVQSDPNRQLSLSESPISGIELLFSVPISNNDPQLKELAIPL